MKETTQKTTKIPIVKNNDISRENECLKGQIEQLQQDMRELKSESLEREKRLMALLEHKKESDGGILGKLFK